MDTTLAIICQRLGGSSNLQRELKKKKKIWAGESCEYILSEPALTGANLFELFAFLAEIVVRT